MKQKKFLILICITLFALVSVCHASSINDTRVHGGGEGGSGNSSSVSKGSAGISINTTPTAPEIIYTGKTFGDIAETENKEAIEALAQRGIISGVPGDLFLPESSVTRAEFTVIIAKALSLEGGSQSTFSDIKPDDWFCSYVNAAFDKGIVSGVSSTEFNPYGTITRQEAASMVTNAINLCGIDTFVVEARANNILSEFSDGNLVPVWSREKVAFCLASGILTVSGDNLNPAQPVTRAEISQMVWNMLNKAELV